MIKNQIVLPLIPYPQKINFLSGSFLWSEKTVLSINRFSNEIYRFLEAFPASLHPILTTDDDQSHLIINMDASMSEEVYQLNIHPNQIEIVAASSAGVFYALQSLRQLILAEYQEVMEQITLPCLEISDYPRFVWRGFMLDEARHFQGMQTVKDILDWMAYIKLNIFHWHLTEDQGWRIEIKQ
ncbi:MAG TPA: family 20 glycosylhydrolase, partial [Anaerolineaceae bacterium]|nr:family 20 glycosylhydrolase [Anaerolineaceae bacterium]